MVLPSYPKARQVAELYRGYVQDPGSIDPAWRDVFQDLDEEARGWLESLNGFPAAEPARPVAGIAAGTADARAAALDSVRALTLIRSYRVRGHLEADLDPLGLAPKEPHPELDPATYGFSEPDMGRPIFLHGTLGLETATMREILQIVRRDYSGTIGLEYMHLQDPDQKEWIQNRMEGVMHHSRMNPRNRVAILEYLTAAETFERFLDRKYTGTKRFGLEGCEAALPALETIVRLGAQEGIEEIVIGMTHRGRLNVLANLMQKPLEAIFHEFHGGASTPDEIGGSGDVKYHLGTSTDREIDGKKVHLSLVPNPSHLEAVDPVVVGKVRSSQDQLGDVDRSRVLGLLIHGDAAFAGQGVVAETLQFSEIEGYETCGSVHLIINNQIGFTTNPVAARSTPYPSDVAKGVQAPIVHVNGDDPEAVVQATAFALEFRLVFKRDVVIDLFCYRRHGHNEGDEPAFTQPLMYKKIATHPTVREIYAARLIGEGLVSQAEADEMVGSFGRRLEQAFAASRDYKPRKADWLEGSWTGLERMEGVPIRSETGVEIETLRKIGVALTTVPDGLNVNRKILRQLKTKGKMFETGDGFDWATAEALAFGSLLLEGHPVRLSGEDTNRGTFSQRHASWIDQETEAAYVPLNHIQENQESLEVLDSPLSEFGMLGFEYGYAMDEPWALVLWEAQFGDFANGGQVIIDQFIAPGEAKWLRMNGLVMLLPHGYEGQGPEHSSARPERFLQLAAEGNIQVVNCTTPANYFHVLRRQLDRKFRKPLIVMTPKSLLRHKRVVSRLDDFAEGSHFHPVLEGAEPADSSDVRRLVLCSGKVYYDLLQERDQRGLNDVKFLRIEELYPFPATELTERLEPYTSCEIIWCQEEPRNMGAWSFIAERILQVAEKAGLDRPIPRYVGRKEAASPATGIHERHVEQQTRLVSEALGGA